MLWSNLVNFMHPPPPHPSQTRKYINLHQMTTTKASSHLLLGHCADEGHNDLVDKRAEAQLEIAGHVSHFVRCNKEESIYLYSASHIQFPVLYKTVCNLLDHFLPILIIQKIENTSQFFPPDFQVPNIHLKIINRQTIMHIHLFNSVQLPNINKRFIIIL